MISRGNTQICPLIHIGAGQKGPPEERDGGHVTTLYQTQNRFKVFNFIFASPSAGRLYIPSVASSNGQDGREWRKEIWNHKVPLLWYLAFVFQNPKLGFYLDPVFQRPLVVTKKPYLSTVSGKVLFNDETKCLKFV